MIFNDVNVVVQWFTMTLKTVFYDFQGYPDEACCVLNQCQWTFNGLSMMSSGCQCISTHVSGISNDACIIFDWYVVYRFRCLTNKCNAFHLTFDECATIDSWYSISVQRRTTTRRWYCNDERTLLIDVVDEIRLFQCLLRDVQWWCEDVSLDVHWLCTTFHDLLNDAQAICWS